MRPNALATTLRHGAPAVTAWMSVGDPYLGEVLSHCGYDAVTVDLQHGMFDLETAIDVLRAVGSGPATPMARCPRLDPSIIGKLLDAGAYGIICPSVDSAEQAAAFVRACRYPPTGERSFGPSRGLLYGGPDYVEHADRTVLAWAMVESAAALDDLEAIVATPGLDGVYVGPNDLALSLGERPGTVEAPPVVEEALLRIVEAAHAAGIFAGGFSADARQARRLADAGFDLVTPGSDVGLIRQAAADGLDVIRGAGRGGASGGY